MNFLPLILLLSQFIVTSSAKNRTISELHIESKEFIFSDYFSNLLAILSFHTVLRFISPLLLKLAFIPLFIMLKLISKPFVMIGLTGYLMAILTPFILARSGMANPVFEGRAQSSDGIFSSLGRLMSTNLSVVASETMDFFNLDNEECKLELACRAGKKIANTLPYLQYFATQSGASNWIQQKYISDVVRSMTETKDCANLCESLKKDNQNYLSATYSSDSGPKQSESVFEWLGK